jgi:peptidoglycan/LPS O-acetylase OafA/YrhL
VNSSLSEIRPLTGLRFILAAWVVLYHYRGILRELIPSFQTLDWITAKGGYAVPVFFILSGFIISYNYLDKFQKKDYLPFVWKRFARLWPVHCAVIFLFYLLFILSEKLGVYMNTVDFPTRGLAFELLMVRTWFQTELLFNKPAWSIQSEWFAYLFVFPACALLFKLKWGNAALLALAAVLLVCYELISPSFSFGSAPLIIFPFLAGSAMYLLRKRLTRMNRSGPWALCILFFILIFLKYDLAKHGFPIFYCLCAAFLFFLSYSHGTIQAFLSWNPIHFGGLISYSLYMTHHFFEVIWTPVYARLEPNGSFGKVIFAVLLILSTLALAAAFYLLIEKPANRFLVKNNPFQKNRYVR